MIVGPYHNLVIIQEEGVGINMLLVDARIVNIHQILIEAVYAVISKAVIFRLCMGVTGYP